MPGHSIINPSILTTKDYQDDLKSVSRRQTLYITPLQVDDTVPGLGKEGGALERCPEHAHYSRGKTSKNRCLSKQAIFTRENKEASSVQQRGETIIALNFKTEKNIDAAAAAA